MKEKEKYVAEIKARFLKCDESLKEIKKKQEQAKENVSQFNMDDIIEKHKKAGKKLEEIEKADESTWAKLKSEFNDLISGIDTDLRKAISLYK